jgi:ABC-type transport system substrate-binding protein
MSALLLALGIIPALAQDAPSNMTMSDSGLITYAAPSCDYGGEFLSIEAVDESTVKFTLCYPDPAFPSKVAFSAFGIHPSEYLESSGGGGDIVQNPIGTGPYMLENWDLGNEAVFTRNENYWGEPANEATLIFRWNSESAQRLTELQAGNVDAIDNPGPLDIPVIEGDSNLMFMPREGTNVFYVGMNNTIAPFDNVKVRQAVSTPSTSSVSSTASIRPARRSLPSSCRPRSSVTRRRLSRSRMIRKWRVSFLKKQRPKTVSRCRLKSL